MLINAVIRIRGSKIFVCIITVMLSLNLFGQTESQKISLKEAIEIGLKNNQEIKSAVENISASKGRYWSGISLPQPELGLSYEYVPVSKSLSDYSEKTFSISQSIEFPSNYLLRGNKFSKEEEIALENLKQAEKHVKALIKTNYYKTLAKRDKIKLAEQNLKICEDFFKKAEIRQNVGEGTHLEKLTAKVQFTEARNNLEIAKSEYSLALADLNFSLGYNQEQKKHAYVLTDSLMFEEHGINQDKLYTMIEETNPEIRIANLRSGVASIEKNLAWSSLLPNFSISYFKQTRDGDTGLYGASFGISLPLWFMFDQRGKIQEAIANHSISESEIQLTKNEIELKLKNVLNDFNNNLRQVQLYRNDLLPQAEEIYVTAEKSYDEGELTYLEYLQARQTLVSSKSNYINTLYNYYETLFRIEEIAGENTIENFASEK